MKKILYIVIFTLLFTESIYAETKKEKVKIYKGWSIPQYVKPDPNLATIKHYFKKDYKLYWEKHSDPDWSTSINDIFL